MILAALPPRPGRLLVFGEGKGPFSGWSQSKRRLDARMLEGRREVARQQGAEPTWVKPMPPWTPHDRRRTVSTGLQRLKMPLEVTEAVPNPVSGSRAGVVGICQRHKYETEMHEALAERLVPRSAAGRNQLAATGRDVVVRLRSASEGVGQRYHTTRRRAHRRFASEECGHLQAAARQLRAGRPHLRGRPTDARLPEVSALEHLLGMSAAQIMFVHAVDIHQAGPIQIATLLEEVAGIIKITSVPHLNEAVACMHGGLIDTCERATERRAWVRVSKDPDLPPSLFEGWASTAWRIVDPAHFDKRASTQAELRAVIVRRRKNAKLAVDG